ncbi:MAG: hypothetical protein GY772_17350, partial [bacterium]|nr:hypothetical protein [bacterium]
MQEAGSTAEGAGNERAEPTQDEITDSFLDRVFNLSPQGTSDRPDDLHPHPTHEAARHVWERCEAYVLEGEGDLDPADLLQRMLDDAGGLNEIGEDKEETIDDDGILASTQRWRERVRSAHSDWPDVLVDLGVAA